MNLTTIITRYVLSVVLFLYFQSATIAKNDDNHEDEISIINNLRDIIAKAKDTNEVNAPLQPYKEETEQSLILNSSGGLLTDLPFALTNKDVEYTKKDKIKFTYTTLGDPKNYLLLKNIKEIHPWFGDDYFEAEIVSPSDFKKAVEKELQKRGLEHVLYYIHSTNTDPNFPLDEAFTLNQQSNKKYLAIPILWRNPFETSGPAKSTSRQDHALLAGMALSDVIEVFQNTPYTQSVMAHSQGNYVFRHFAGNIDADIAGPNMDIFRHFFSLAADERIDTYLTDTGFNPAAEAAGRRELLRANEVVENGGFHITHIVGHVYVLWNDNDGVLSTQEKLLGAHYGTDAYKAIGRHGAEAKNRTQTSKYFCAHVSFHDFTDIVEDNDLDDHNYHLSDEAVSFYEIHTNLNSGDNSC